MEFLSFDIATGDSQVQFTGLVNGLYFACWSSFKNSAVICFAEANSVNVNDAKLLY